MTCNNSPISRRSIAASSTTTYYGHPTPTFTACLAPAGVVLRVRYAVREASGFGLCQVWEADMEMSERLEKDVDLLSRIKAGLNPPAVRRSIMPPA